MTRIIEEKAKAYLLTAFSHPTCSFTDRQATDQGFDLWLNELGRVPRKIELKATDAIYHRPSNLFERLVFNAEIEKQLFESGESVIVRVFLGSTPPRVFIITNEIFAAGAQLTAEARYVLRGRVNYQNSIIELA